MFFPIFDILFQNFKYIHMVKNRIAVCQLTSSHDKIQNFNTCKNMIEKCGEEGAKMVFFPECFDFISRNRKEFYELSEPLNGPLISQYKLLAKSSNIWLSLGGFHRKICVENFVSTQGQFNDDEKIMNTHIIINNVGEIVATYDKVHLFDLEIPNKIRLKESDFTLPGEGFKPPVQTPIGKIGLLICYDIRFPSASSLLAQNGAQILTYPSAFTIPTGEAHWEILNRARAIENRCYVVSAAQVGQHNPKRASYGHSMVVDPWGKILIDMGGVDNLSCQSSASFEMIDIDVEGTIADVRSKLPDVTLPKSSQPWLGNIYQNLLIESAKASQSPKSILLPLVGGEESDIKFPFGPRTFIHPTCIIARTLTCYAFVNRSPLLPGHVLITTLRSSAVTLTYDCTCGERDELFALATILGRVLTSHYRATSCNYTVQDGTAAGRTVSQVHLHVIPRHKGDLSPDKGPSLSGQDDDDDGNAIYRRLAEHDANHCFDGDDGGQLSDKIGGKIEGKSDGRKFRSLEEMASEASTYRELVYGKKLEYQDDVYRFY